MPKVSESFDLSSYALVADRIVLFYERYPQGRITTKLISRDRDVTFRASVYRTASDRSPAATGWASEREGDGDVNMYACVENTETSAIGRALANLGFTASRKRPSREEMAKVERARRGARGVAFRPQDERRPQPVAQPVAQPPAAPPDTDLARDDLAMLLDDAEAHEFPRERATLIRSLLRDRSLDQQAIVRLESAIRAWVDRRVHRHSGSSPKPQPRHDLHR